MEAARTKGKRDARIELSPAVIDHLETIRGFEASVFDWPHCERMLWADFKKLKEAASVSFSGAFHRFRFGFANANVDSLNEGLLQELMRHRDRQTTRHYINVAERMKRSGVGERLHVPAFLKTDAG